MTIREYNTAESLKETMEWMTDHFEFDPKAFTHLAILYRMIKDAHTYLTSEVPE